MSSVCVTVCEVAASCDGQVGTLLGSPPPSYRNGVNVSWSVKRFEWPVEVVLYKCLVNIKGLFLLTTVLP